MFNVCGMSFIAVAEADVIQKNHCQLYSFFPVISYIFSYTFIIISTAFSKLCEVKFIHYNLGLNFVQGYLFCSAVQELKVIIFLSAAFRLVV